MISILIMDDERIIRTGLQKMIADHCPQITQFYQAGNGEKGLDIVIEHKPDICLVDIRMPVMDGLQFAEIVHKNGYDTHMLILSGYADFEYAQRAMEFGCEGYLLKPAKIEELTRYLQSIIRTIELQDNEDKKEDLSTDQKEYASLIVKKAVRYINAHMNLPISVNEIADELGIGNSYLSTLFRRDMDTTLIDYINQNKMKKACELLRETTMKNYEISRAVGCMDEKYFFKVFKKYVGLTPNEYRRQCEYSE